MRLAGPIGCGRPQRGPAGPTWQYRAQRRTTAHGGGGGFIGGSFRSPFDMEKGLDSERRTWGIRRLGALTPAPAIDDRRREEALTRWSECHELNGGRHVRFPL
jgi:hypothetical protein